MASRFLCGALVGVAVLVGGCQSRPPVVRIGEKTITVEEVVDEARRPAGAPQSEEPRELAMAALRRIVVKEVVVAAPMTPGETARLERAESQRALQQCIAVETKRLLASRYDLEQEVRARFAESPERYTLPESFRLQMIFIPEDEPGGEQLAQDLLGKLQEDPGRFARLAREHSRSETAAAGGETRPMPGSAVHPVMRSAIKEHRSDDEVFLVELDRGWYLIKVLEHWPPPDADLVGAEAHVRAAVGSELVAELQAEMVEEARRRHEIRVREDALAQPELSPDMVVLEIDGEQVTVGDLMPVAFGEGVVPAPLVRRQLDQYRSWREPALFLGCEAQEDPQITDGSVLALRLPEALRQHVEAEMTAELRRFVELHRQALVREPHHVFDLWIMPFGEDPYRSHARLKRLLAAADPLDEQVVAAAGALLRRRVRASVGQVDQYDSGLSQALSSARVGECSPIIRSSRNRAFLAALPIENEPERPLSLNDPDDRRQIVERFLEASSQKVVDALADHHLDDERACARLVDAVARRLAGNRVEPVQGVARP